jgi:transcriptional regulator with XRE-family HTH domain
MFDVCKAAKLRPDDLSKLLKVSRTTVSLWFNGHTKPHHLLIARVERLLQAIEDAYVAGQLPVPHDIPRRERGLYLSTTVRKHISPEVSLDSVSN